MQPSEFDEMRSLSIAAFGGDEHIGTLLDGLRASWAWEDELAFVAVQGDELVGQVVYTKAFVDDPERLVDVLVLSPVGVRPDLQQQGIGGQLITESLAALAGRSEQLVFLEGSPRYYPRLGFTPGGDSGFLPPSERIPAPAFQVIALDGAEPSVSGRLVYNDAFWRTDSVGLRDELDMA